MKKLVSVMLILVLCLAAMSVSFAGENKTASSIEIKEAIAEVNKKYDMNFQYIDNGTEAVSK